MEKRSAIAQPEKEAAPVRLLQGSDFFDRVRELSNAIARRAFELFDGRRRADGHDPGDWFRAESEFLHPLHLDLAESGDAFTVRAEVPGFSAKELEVGVEPHRFTISGKRETSEENTSKKTIYTEQCSN
jgi:HSP20 family molecular chaperone IbpA